jgi:hypothetical protein
LAALLLQGGELELTLLLGDPSAPKGVSGVLGTIELPEGASGAAPKPKLLTARHQPISNVKSNIAHTFVSGNWKVVTQRVEGREQQLVLWCWDLLLCTRRSSHLAYCVPCLGVCPPQRPPAKRGPAVVSLAFTGLALAPLALLVIYLGMLGVNFKVRGDTLAQYERRDGHKTCLHVLRSSCGGDGTPLTAGSPVVAGCVWPLVCYCAPLPLQGLPTGASNLWVMLFHGGIAAMLGLYLLFWVKLNLAQTAPLALLLGLFIAGVFAGSRGGVYCERGRGLWGRREQMMGC